MGVPETEEAGSLIERTRKMSMSTALSRVICVGLAVALLVTGCGGAGSGSPGGGGGGPPLAAPLAAPAIRYGATTLSITAQAPVTLAPTNSGGAVASYGSIMALTGSPTRLAAATASGQTLVYDTSNWSLVTTLHQGLFSKIQISDDGSVLATLGADSFGSLQSPVQMVSLPSAAVINTWNYDWDNGPTVATDITLSSSGLLLGQVIQGIGHVASGRQVTA